MKKIILALCTLGLLASCSKKSNDEPAPQPAPETAKVVIGIEEKHFTVLPNTEDPNELVRRIVKKYNDKGLEIEAITYDDNGLQKMRDTYEYNPSGKLIRNQHQEQGANHSKEFIYDTNGRMIEEITQTATNTQEKSVLAYDKQGYAVGLKNYTANSNGTWPKEHSSETIYTNNDKGQRIREQSYTFFGIMQFLTMDRAQTYDDLGQVITKTELDSDGELVAFEKISYIAGKLNLVEREEEQRKLDSGETLNTTNLYKYTFDKQGNWTKLVKIQNGTPIQVLTRTYTYK